MIARKIAILHEPRAEIGSSKIFIHFIFFDRAERVGYLMNMTGPHGGRVVAHVILLEMDESMVSVEDGDSAIVVLSPIANPLATDKLSKKILKLVKAGNRSENL